MTAKEGTRSLNFCEGEWSQKETILHPMNALRSSTNELLTELKTFSSFQLQTYDDNFTNSLTKVERRLKTRRGSVKPMHFNRRAFLHTIGCPKTLLFFSSTNSRSSGQTKNDTKTLFSHPPSPIHGNFCNCNSIGICTASRF